MADCSVVKAVESCKSFNEMIQNRDDEILVAIKYPSFVCFRPDEDEFFMFSDIEPSDLVYKDVSKTMSQATSIAFYYRYKKGVQSDLRYIDGTWTKITYGPAPIFSFQSRKDGDASLSITNSEISLGYDYKNLAGSTTAYAIQVRRSTKRFVETFQFPDEPTPAQKGKAPTTQHESKTRAEFTGYCAEFK